MLCGYRPSRTAGARLVRRTSVTYRQWRERRTDAVTHRARVCCTESGGIVWHWTASRRRMTAHMHTTHMVARDGRAQIRREKRCGLGICGTPHRILGCTATVLPPSVSTQIDDFLRSFTTPNARRQRRVTGGRHTNRKKAYAVTRPLNALVRMWLALDARVSLPNPLVLATVSLSTHWLSMRLIGVKPDVNPKTTACSLTPGSRLMMG